MVREAGQGEKPWGSKLGQGGQGESRPENFLGFFPVRGPSYPGAFFIIFFPTLTTLTTMTKAHRGVPGAKKRKIRRRKSR